MNSIIKLHTNTFKNINEDFVHASENISFVIDGASGLSGKNHIDGSNDVVWFVDFWKKHLISSLENYSFTLEEIVSIGVEKVLSDYKKVVKNFDCIPVFDYPSASIAIIRRTKLSFEYFVLGDCTAIFKLNNDHRLLKIKDDRVTKFDKRVISLIKTRRNALENNSFEFTKNESEMLLSNRMKKNTDGGYYILEFDLAAVKEAITGSIDVKDVGEFIISSDGFSISHETYGIVKEKELFNVLKSEGPNKFIEKIRRLELQNDSIKRFPRLKIHDDCSVMHYQNLCVI
ncbi:MAG: hypothetical protein WBA54_12660 [Acidaminobacteraceae bacterium]